MTSNSAKNRFNVEKLLYSKWTAVIVKNRQKHFIVTELIRDEISQKVVTCVVQAVINDEFYHLNWRDLKDTESWLQGWK